MSSLVASAWFAVQTRPRHEQAVVRQLAQKGYECLLPTYRVRRRWSDRVKEIVEPLFAGYAFCRIDQHHPMRVITTPGVIRLVGIAGRPMPIDEDEILAIQRIVTACRQAEPVPYLCVGQQVRIEAGSLIGLEGILLEMRGHRRIVVSVSLLQRSVAVELDEDLVSVMKQPRVCEDETPRYFATP